MISTTTPTAGATNPALIEKASKNVAKKASIDELMSESTAAKDNNIRGSASG